jgi:hypothetical protein
MKGSPWCGFERHSGRFIGFFRRIFGMVPKGVQSCLLPLREKVARSAG